MSCLMKQITLEVLDNLARTEIVCTVYEDRIFILISQINKVGTLLSAWTETKENGDQLYFVESLFGSREDPVLNVYARCLIERISKETRLPLLLAISLSVEGKDKETLRCVTNKIMENPLWL